MTRRRNAISRWWMNLRLDYIEARATTCTWRRSMSSHERFWTRDRLWILVQILLAETRAALKDPVIQSRLIAAASLAGLLALLVVIDVA